MQPERDFRCNYHEVCDDPICDGVGHCRDAAPIVEVQKPSTNSDLMKLLCDIKTLLLDVDTPTRKQRSDIVHRIANVNVAQLQ